MWGVGQFPVKAVVKIIASDMIKKLMWPALGAVLGAGTGYLYWLFIGCTGDVCPIYSVWWRSTLYGAVLGGLVFSLLEDGRRYLKNLKSKKSLK
jgi:hypothetical protein